MNPSISIDTSVCNDEQPIAAKRRSFKLSKRSKRIIRKCYAPITKKFLYPIIYVVSCRKKIEPNKVIFLEPRVDTLTNSVMLLYDEFERMGGYELHTHLIKEKTSRHRTIIKNYITFVKDLATARYLILADICDAVDCLPKRDGTVVLNTWHGCGAFKKFGYSTAEKIFGGNAEQKSKYHHYRNCDIVTVSSPEICWAYEEAMNLHNGQIEALGVSRTDVFYDDEYIKRGKEKVLNAVPEIGDRKIIVYAPTFRGRVRQAAGPNELDIEALQSALGDEYYLLIKHHPFVNKPPAIPETAEGVFATDVSRILNIDELLCAADICISDYSSLIFEYSILNRPMIFFAYDLDEYFDWRGFYYDYYELAPGPICKTTDQIISYIENLDEEFDLEKVKAFNSKFMSSCDGNSTQRIMDRLLNF